MTASIGTIIRAMENMAMVLKEGINPENIKNFRQSKKILENPKYTHALMMLI